MKRSSVFFWQLLLMVFLFESCKKAQTIIEPPVQESSDKTIHSFIFNKSSNPHLLFDIAGEINGDTIFLRTFSGTRIDSLVPEFSFTGDKVIVENDEQTSGITAHSFVSNKKYTVIAKDRSKKTYVVKFTDTGLPTIYISTNMIEIDSKDEYVDGNIKIIKDIKGEVLVDAVTEIKGRGNSTWKMPKKPYRIKLDKKEEILGMPKSKHWVLLANYADKSLIRNELAFQLSRASGLEYTPRSRFVEVILNGQYMGNYALVEQIREDEDRVNIKEQDEDTTLPPDITGGYMLEIDAFAAAEPAYFITSRGIPVTIKYPDDDEINSHQKNYISSHFQKFEDALFSENFKDPENGYKKYFDINSYVDYYIINEVMGNPDIFWSTHMHKKRNDDKLYTGPIWDFDIAVNNDNRIGDVSAKLMLNVAHGSKHVINRLMEDPAFRQKIRNRWNEFKLHVNLLPIIASNLENKLAHSQAYNFTRWNILNQTVYFENYIGGTYDEEVKYVKNFLVKRANWLDATFNSDTYK